MHVSNGSGDTVTPIAAVAGTPGPPIRIGVNRPGLSDKPVAIAITPNGSTVYAANTEDADDGSGTVTPIDTATNMAGPAIPVGSGPWAIAVTPDRTGNRLCRRLGWQSRR